MIPEPQPATNAAGPAADLMITAADPATTGDHEATGDQAAARPPGVTVKSIVYGLLSLAIPLAVLVVWVMAASSADPTGGCGGG